MNVGCYGSLRRTSQMNSRGSICIHKVIAALSNTLRLQGGWLVKQVSFIAGARSLNEQDLRKNLEFFKVPQAGIKAIRSKIAMEILKFDEYTNILKGMYSTRFNGSPPTQTLGKSLRGCLFMPLRGSGIDGRDGPRGK